MGEKACHIPDILGRGLDEKQKEQAQNFAATGIIRIHRYEGSTYSLRSLGPVGTCGSQNFHFTKGPYLITTTQFSVFWIPSPLVCILARFIILKSCNLPYYIYI